MDRYSAAYHALGAVVDPELDEPITDLGFVRSLTVTPSGNVKVHLRLPTSFCSPNFAYLMASDAKDVLAKLDWTRRVVVELDDHHDSAIINAGLASDAGYRGTFGHEGPDTLLAPSPRVVLNATAYARAERQYYDAYYAVAFGPAGGLAERNP